MQPANALPQPFAEPPKTAKLRVFKIREINDLIFVWWGIEGRKPQWNLLADSPDQVGWSDFKIRTIRFPGHPQETRENSVDLAHLRYVHGYDNVNCIGRVSVDVPYLKSRFDFRRAIRIAKTATIYIDISDFRARVWIGLLFCGDPRTLHRDGYAPLGVSDTC